jgi:hypothetical protein
MRFSQHMTTMLRATAVAVSVAALAAPVATAKTRGTGDQSDAVSRYVTNHGASVPQHGVQFITDTLAPGGGAPDAISRYVANRGAPAQPAGVHLVTDTLAPGGGAAGAVSPGVDGVNWRDTGLGFFAALVLLGILLGGRFLLQGRKGVVA